MERLDGKVAIVTGAGSGIGAATGQLMADQGAAVVIADVDGDGAQSVADLIRSTGGTAEAVTVDVADEEQIREMTARTQSWFGRIDILHNNAAALGPEVLGQDRDVVSMTVELWDFTMAVTLRGVMLGCKHALPLMLEQGSGVIINTASTAGQTGDLSRPAYGAAKAGVINFTRYLATMYGRYGIRCNAVSPGLVLSPPALANMSSEQLEISRRNRLTDRAGTPQDIAAMVTFLASDAASFVTGQIVNVDGGVLAHFPNYSDQIRAMEGLR